MVNLRWCIFYVDGTTFDNQDGEPQDAPGFGVAAIFQEDDAVGSAVHEGEDFYVFGPEFGGWYGIDYFGLAQYLGRPGLKIVKLGEVMPLSAYRALLKRVRDDPSLPTKSARYEWEPPF